MAALLHDIGHVPFSHTLEDEHLVLPKHDKGKRLDDILELLRQELLDQEARDMVDRAKPILHAISGTDGAEPDWRSDLVGNTVCADLLAYITTDAAWTGIEKRPGYYRIYDYFAKEDNRFCIRLTKGGLRTDIVSAILDLLDMRYALTERVIFHHAKCVASAMLARAARLCDLQENDELLKMGDEVFLDHLESLVRGNNATEAKGAGLVLGALRARRLYKRIFKVNAEQREIWDKSREEGEFCSRWRNGRNIEELLAKVEQRYTLPRGALVLWCPDGQSGMKLVKAQVVWEHAGGWHGPVELRSSDVEKHFPGVYHRVDQIEKQYLDLWTFWAAIHPDHVKQAPGVVETLAEELEIPCDPVFCKSYMAQHIEGFPESEKLWLRIMDAWHNRYMPEVFTLLQQEAAYADKEIDTVVIDETIADVVGRKKRGSKEKGLFPPGEQTEDEGSDAGPS